MDSSRPDTRTLRPLPPSSHHGTRYDPETRELAYQLYAFKHGRNAEAVARELGADEGKCPGLEGRTVRRWAVEGGWADRADREIRELAPAIHAANVASLIAGSAEAVQAVREIQRGEFRDPQHAAVRLKAAEITLNRTGYPGMAKVQLTGDSGQPQTDYTGLDMAEIIERQRKFLERGT